MRLAYVCLAMLLAAAPAVAADNELTAKEKAEGWILLFDGKTLDGWMTSGGKPSKTPIEHGAINPHKSGGYMMVQGMPTFDDDESTMLIVEEKAKFTPPASANDDTNFVDEIVFGAKGEEDDEEGEVFDDAYVETARAIKVGTWVEFRDKTGHIERAKLSWISPISAKYLFVNRKGLKVGDKTVWGLAAELRAGSAEILEDVPLFDRALDAIVERLKSSAAAPVEAVAGADAVSEGSIGDHI